MSLLESEITRAYDAWLVRKAAKDKADRLREQKSISQNVTSFCHVLNESLGIPLIKELYKIGMKLEGQTMHCHPHAVLPWCDTTVAIYASSGQLKLCQLSEDGHEFNHSCWYENLSQFREALLSRLGGLRAEYQAKQQPILIDWDTRPDQ